jgi:hypothetical protein
MKVVDQATGEDLSEKIEAERAERDASRQRQKEDAGAGE